jgi:hypothetical protein
MPAPREGAAMAYDPGKRTAVLFGGATFDSPAGGGQTLNDTWTFQGRMWTERHPATTPPPMLDPLMVWDDLRAACVLVGVPIGAESGAGPAQTWGWDGSNWSRLDSVPLGTYEITKAMAYDFGANEVVLVTWVASALGGPYNDTHTWTWSGSGAPGILGGGSWSLRQPSRALPAVSISRGSLSSLGPDASGSLSQTPHGVLAVIGGGTGSGSQTWVWDGATWTEAAAGSTPPYSPLGATMAEDPTSGEIVLIGLLDSGGGQTWLWSGTSWRLAGAAPNVDTLYGGTWVLSDRYSRHVILIGDSGRPNRFDVLWTFDGKAWVSDRSD